MKTKMPMYVKLDICQRGNIEAQVRYSKRGDTDFDGVNTLVKARSVADVFAALSKHFRGLPIEKPENAPSKESA